MGLEEFMKLGENNFALFFEITKRMNSFYHQILYKKVLSATNPLLPISGLPSQNGKKINRKIRLIPLRELNFGNQVIDSKRCKFSEDGSLLLSAINWSKSILMWHTEELLNSEAITVQPTQIANKTSITTVAASSHKGHIFSGDSTENLMNHDAQT